MLATLETIAESEGLPFRFGSLFDENISADSQISGDWLFQEGYLNGSLRLEADNSVSITYTVNLWILAPSNLADRPARRGPELIGLLGKLIRVYRKISNYGNVGPGNFIEGVNLLDRNVDGIRLSFSFTPLLPFSVC